VKTLVAVIEGQENGFFRQSLSPLGGIDDVLIADHMVARPFEPGEMAFKVLLTHRDAVKWRDAFFFWNDVVVVEGDEGIIRRLHGAGLPKENTGNEEKNRAKRQCHTSHKARTKESDCARSSDRSKENA